EGVDQRLRIRRHAARLRQERAQAGRRAARPAAPPPAATLGVRHPQGAVMSNELGRRSFLLSAGTLAAAPLLGGLAPHAVAQVPPSSVPPAPSAMDRRLLNRLEVSSIGLG